jgi:hypothetical protein
MAQRRTGRLSADRIFPALILAGLLGAGAAFGLLGRYPFGGTPRHQVLLLFFAVLAGFVAFDGLLPSAKPAGRALLAMACAGAIGWNAVRNREEIHHFGRDQPLNVRAGTFRENLARGGTVHLDQMNFIGLFMDYYAWDCRFAGRVADNPLVERYEFSRNGPSLTVIAHRWIWRMDFRSQPLYDGLRASFPRGVQTCERVFCVDRNIFKARRTARPEMDRTELQAQIPGRARAVGLTTSALVLRDDFVDAVFCIEP